MKYFKPGDIVRRTCEGFLDVEINGIYTVKAIGKDSTSEPYILLKEIKGGYTASKFELVLNELDIIDELSKVVGKEFFNNK